jgi:hypothetical protein
MEEKKQTQDKSKLSSRELVRILDVFDGEQTGISAIACSFLLILFPFVEESYIPWLKYLLLGKIVWGMISFLFVIYWVNRIWTFIEHKKILKREDIIEKEV